jgi:DNA-binding GntR family transcriptional regulator
MRVTKVAAPLRQQVVDVLREAIIEMRFQPGQRLIERELIEQTGVSRTSIREALRELAAEGLVTTIPNRGVVVATPSRQEAEELYEIRVLLEGMVARQFVERASDADVRALRRAYERIERAAAADKGLLASKDGFYRVLFEGAANPTVQSVLSGVHARVTVLRAASLSETDRPAHYVEAIRAIVEAVEARDGQAAARATAEHVHQAAIVVLRRLDHDLGAEQSA